MTTSGGAGDGKAGETAGINMYLIFWGLVVALLSALNPILSKPILNDGYHYATLLLLGSVFFGTGSLIFAAMRHENVIADMLRIDLKTVCIIAIVNLLCGFVGNMLFYHLLSDHHSHLVTAITATMPIFTFFIAYIFLSEPVSLTSILGIILVVVGAVIAMS